MPQRGMDFNNQNGVDTNTAPLTNVSLCIKAMLRVKERARHLPGFVCFYGPSGWGKSKAAAYVANKQHAYYIECKERWPRKAVFLAILRDMGIEPAKTQYEMLEQVCRQLASSGRPLIVDEFDHLVNRGYVEMIRDIYEGSGAAILLVGEEMLPQKLKRWERFYGRVLDWIPAQPADFDDCRSLAQFYCDRVTIKDELLAVLHKRSRGSARRIVVYLDRVQDWAGQSGLDVVGLQEAGDRDFYEDEAPKRSLLL